jgi:N-terminal acetyltransferase B complex non-catalytic subunit
LDRSLRLVRLAFRRYLGQELLADCKDYWQHHSRLVSCFTDMRRSVELLSAEERAEFLQFIEEQTRDSAPTSGDNEV